ncbi:hypothetical protein AX17_007013 [Amanita inopinata Kibby_2008]|nr:hypothetical protein AX17_007013 [Amanita inopinata Kibby_2008]
MSVQDLVAGFLSSSEQLKVVLETLVSADPSTTELQTTPEVIDARYNVQDTRILAVVSHKDEWNMSEEGCVFVCRYKHPNNGSLKDLHIQRAFPIFGHFTITMAQARRMTIDLSPNATKSAQTQPRTGFCVTVHGSESDSDALTFFTHDVKKLQQFIQECKRLKEAFDSPEKAEQSQLTLEFQWLTPYINELKSLSQLLSDVPPDLRVANTPLLNRLSPSSAGYPGDDVTDLRLIRDDWVRSRAQELASKGTYSLSIRIGTFNVNGKNPSQDLSTWVRGMPSENVPDGFSSLSLNDDKPLDERMTGSTLNTSRVDVFLKKLSDELADNETDSAPDLLVLGFQELDQSAEALLYSTTATREEAWCAAVFAALGEKGPEYDKLVSRQLVGMLIVIFAKKSVKPYFTDIRTCAVGAGIMGVMGNKGATAVLLTFTPKAEIQMGVKAPNSTIFAFVNSHLAAYDESVDRRNLDFHDLSKRLIFETHLDPFEDPDEAVENSIPWLGLYNADALFWLGGNLLFPCLMYLLYSYGDNADLNYRIDLPDEDIREIVVSEDWDNKFEHLQTYDQLSKAQSAGAAFKDFREAKIGFPPTYRFTSGILDSSYNTKRKPAWTDRILYYPGPSVEIRQLSYRSYPQITLSDHRPVAADFEINIGFWDKQEHELTMHKLMREARRMEETLGRSTLKVLTASVDFGKVYYRRHSVRTVKLQNNGKVPAAYRFVPIHGEASIHPPWLHVEPMIGMVLPDEIAEITFTIYVDDTTAPKLNMTDKDLKGTVILHSLLGKDHFITLSGEYQYTCFATTLTRLTRLRSPVRTLESPDDYLPNSHAINAPREIMRLVNWMMSGSARIENLFFDPADDVYVQTIRECLDTGDEFPYPPNSEDDRVHLAFGSTLLQFLNSLTSPVVPTTLYERCLQAASRDEAFELLDAFPPSSVNVIIDLFPITKRGS